MMSQSLKDIHKETKETTETVFEKVVKNECQGCGKDLLHGIIVQFDFGVYECGSCGKSHNFDEQIKFCSKKCARKNSYWFFDFTEAMKFCSKKCTRKNSYWFFDFGSKGRSPVCLVEDECSDCGNKIMFEPNFKLSQF